MGWDFLKNYAAWRIDADSESPDISSFTSENGRTTLVLELRVPPQRDYPIAYVNMRGVVIGILGYSEYTPSTASRMTRELPLQHPQYPWMFATEIASIQGRSPKLYSVGGAPASVEIFTRQSQRLGVKIQAYKLYRAVVVFTAVKYNVLRNRSLQESELYRFVERNYQLGLENIIRQGNSFKWVPGTPLAGQSIPQGFVARAPKGVVTYLWRQVPRVGLFGRSGDGWPNNIWDGVGRVNSETFDGCPPGTLLLLPPKFMPISSPYTSFGVEGVGEADSTVAYDVELPMSYIDPPADPAFAGTGPAYSLRGHNLFPPPPGQASGYWYPATHSGAANGTTLYPAYDFQKLFRLMDTG